MIALYKDPQGKRIFRNEMIESSGNTQKLTLQTEKSRVAALEKEIQALQEMVKQQESVSESSRSCQ